MTRSKITPQSFRVGKASSSQNQDDLIMGTNNSSIVSKRSVERLYFPKEQHFFRYFVKKPQRRSPLINRGYWLRMKAVDFSCQQFLETPTTTQKVIINLGCGYDPLPWQCLSRYPNHIKNVIFVDVDYPDLMARKRDTVVQTTELSSMLTGVELPATGNVFLRSNEYLQIGCDLRDIVRLKETLVSALDIESYSVLFVAEVSITYMDAIYSNDLIKWASTLPTARFCLLEQLMPEGKDHPFAKTMMDHFEKLNTSLRAVQQYPNVEAQHLRFKSLGWSSISVKNLWQLWSSPKFLAAEERRSLDLIEPFDEWEEFALFGLHYFLLIADTSNLQPNPRVEVPKFTNDASDNERIAIELPVTPEKPRRLEVSFSENPKGHGCRRFAAGLPLKGAEYSLPNFGNLAGMGLKTRTDTYDVFGIGLDPKIEAPVGSHGSLPQPSRMCHTITDLGEFGALLVGGRMSPDKALADCWLYHKWVNVWERLDDLPQPLYRHQVVNLDDGCALVNTGRTNSQVISNTYFVWSRRFSWKRCHLDGDQIPTPTFGSTFSVLGEGIPPNSSEHKLGILAGGISDDGLLQQAVWEWELSSFTTERPVLRFRRLLDIPARDQSLITRFGASTVSHQGGTYVVGGIIKDTMLSTSDEVSVLIHTPSSLRVVKTTLNIAESISRPLLIGTTVVSAGSSILIMGGSAVCFSFGTFWNKGSFTLISKKDDELTASGSNHQAPGIWCYIQTIGPPTATNRVMNLASTSPIHRDVPRIQITSPDEFLKVLSAGTPAIINGLNIGDCVEKWTAGYLKDKVGTNREVVVHEGTSTHLDFKLKNFAYKTKTFGEFIESVESGGKYYMRALSAENAKDTPTQLATDFPALAPDFVLPKELEYIVQNLHSSPLRISGPVIMWLHYDVMANVLCQIRGQKRLLLFPPSDVMHLGFEPGSSSSSINVFENDQIAGLNGTHPHEALLREGDILFLPSLWLHTAFPTSGMSVAVNMFFKNLENGYAAGRDVYGNRDLAAYEKGRQDVSKIVKSFEGFSTDVRSFYLQRLAAEFQQKLP